MAKSWDLEIDGNPNTVRFEVVRIVLDHGEEGHILLPRALAQRVRANKALRDALTFVLNSPGAFGLPATEEQPVDAQQGETGGVTAEADKRRPIDRWHCGNHHLHVQVALTLIRECRVTDGGSMEWLDNAAYEAGPDFCQSFLQPEVPF